jgi:hypothetical protein
MAPARVCLPFRSPVAGHTSDMAEDASSEKVAMLMIFQAACKTTLQVFQADDEFDQDFVAELQRMIARTEAELVGLLQGRARELGA